MAELVGVIASGISIGTLAAQIAASLIKLKDYWDQIQEAPDEIASLVEEVKDLYHLLANMEDDQRQNPISSLLLDGTSASRCLDHCKRGADRLRDLTEELARDVQHASGMKRKWGESEGSFEKRQVGKVYSTTLVQSLPDIIVARTRAVSLAENTPCSINDDKSRAFPEIDVSSSSTKTLVSNNLKRYFLPYVNLTRFWTPVGFLEYGNSSTFDAGTQEPKQTTQSAQNARYVFRARLRRPILFFNKIWEIDALHARSTWTFTFRTHNIISSNSLVVDRVVEGDVEGVRDLFGQGKASPYDTFRYGYSDYTLLRFAAERGHTELCRFMIQQGADPDFHEGVALTLANPPVHLEKASELVELFRLLLENGFGSPIDGLLAQYVGPTEGLRFLIQHTDTPYYQEPLYERSKNVFYMLRRNHLPCPKNVRIALTQEPLTLETASIEYDNDVTFLQAVTSTIGRVVSHNAYHWKYCRRWRKTCITAYKPWRYCLRELSDWRILSKDIIMQGMDVHAISTSGYTPFLYLLRGLVTIHDPGMNSQILPYVLRIWLWDLAECGVDLEKYGQEERSLLKRELVNPVLESGWRPFQWRQDKHHYMGYTMRLIDFKYGASPDDWHVWISGIGDEVLGDFWQMVEDPEREVPGAWFEDDYDPDPKWEYF